MVRLSSRYDPRGRCARRGRPARPRFVRNFPGAGGLPIPLDGRGSRRSAPSKAVFDSWRPGLSRGWSAPGRPGSLPPRCGRARYPAQGPGSSTQVQPDFSSWRAVADPAALPVRSRVALVRVGPGGSLTLSDPARGFNPVAARFPRFPRVSREPRSGRRSLMGTGNIDMGSRSRIGPTKN